MLLNTATCGIVSLYRGLVSVSIGLGGAYCAGSRWVRSPRAEWTLGCCIVCLTRGWCVPVNCIRLLFYLPSDNVVASVPIMYHPHAQGNPESSQNIFSNMEHVDQSDLYT